MSRYQIITETEALEQYDEMLDMEGPIQVAGMGFYPSAILKEMDRIAYNVGFSDFVDSLSYDNILVEGFTDDDLDEEDDPGEYAEWQDFDPDC
jgi:hypothetical protein